MLSSLWNFLTIPKLPNTSLSITTSHVALIEINKRGGNFHPRKLGVQQLPEGLITASPNSANISDVANFQQLLAALADKAGFSRKLTLSVALPETSCRSIIITLDHKPATRAELQQMLEWKIGRTSALKPAVMKVSYQPLSPQGVQPRWLVSAIHNDVLAQYEKVFAQLGWHAGAILPQNLGESQWLMRSGLEKDEDQVLVSTHQSGFLVVIVRGDEPLLIRDVNCEPAEREDEFFRLMTFYRDRLHPARPLNRFLVISETEEQAIFSQALTAALEHSPQKLAPISLGLSLEPGAPFNRIAAAAGLATLAY